jgi:hypothetical protein
MKFVYCKEQLKKLELGLFQKKNLRDMIPNAPNDAIDLMEKLFTYDPK